MMKSDVSYSKLLVCTPCLLLLQYVKMLYILLKSTRSGIVPQWSIQKSPSTQKKSLVFPLNCLVISVKMEGR